MPASEKPRKARVNAKQAPGQTWVELDTLYRACLNQVAAVCEIGPVLRLPMFGVGSPYHGEILRLSKDLNAKAQNMVTRVEKLCQQYTALQADWEALRAEVKTHRKAGNKEAVVSITHQMEGIEFNTIPMGEAFYAWQADWTNEVIPTYLELSNLMGKTREESGENNER
ncbi:hypothetical protein PP187_gp107 [Klebsiella phage vB_KvM-Eowyn]|uniref:Uncharacterized protein n=1 Tax=Klebsiella phage vB_KvM-Eowyn TaxID=2762819 RepID=A0A7R8MJI8_9CAUD|nr:hypothetical protein PP187_gp107 [Klebsiella phage vB_KvM-Eowyn]CAD5236096.1 hypothetical protein LLCLJKAH_00107 [Klebsiella phage vB_KvM-Eowyn]